MRAQTVAGMVVITRFRWCRKINTYCNLGYIAIPTKKRGQNNLLRVKQELEKLARVLETFAQSASKNKGMQTVDFNQGMSTSSCW